MAWMKVGTTTLSAPTPTYTGDMDSSGWNDSNKGSTLNLDTINNEVDFLNTTGNDSVAFDTSSIETLSASAWVVRFKLRLSGTQSGDWGVFWYVMSSVRDLTSNSTLTDCAGFSTQRDPSSTNINPNLSMGNDDALSSTDVQTRLQLSGSNIQITKDTDYYVEIKRDGSNFTDTVYSDSTFSTILGTKTNAITGSGLRYLVFANYNQGSGSTATVSDFKWYNGVTSLTSKPTNVQDNSILVEKDTANRYWFDEATPITFEDDFDYATQVLADAAWVPANTTYGRVNITTDKLDFDFDTGDGNTDKQVYHDLTSVDTDWIIRFKLNWSAVTSQSNAYMYVGLTDNVGGAGTSQNGFMMRFINAPTSGAVYVNFGVNQLSSVSPSSQGGSGANMVYTTSKDYYVEMKKDGTSLTATVFENSDFTGTWQTATQTITTTITPSLRYLHFWNSMSASTGAWTGTIDDVEFYNGVTSVTPATWTQFGMNLIGLITGGYSTVEVNTVELFDGVSFYAGGQLLEARYNHFGGGDSSDALVGGGSTTAIYGASRTTESFNGTSWSSESLLNTGRHTLGGDGNSTDGICFQGLIGGSDQSITEEYNGTSWSTGGSANARRSVGGGGSSTDAITFGGYNGGNQANTQEYNGTAWSNGGSLASGTRELQGGGNSSHGVSIGGTTSSVVTTCATYNGSSWTSTGSLNTAQADQAGDGDETTAFSAGGSQGSKNNVESYNGTAWTDLTVLSTGRTQLKGGLKVS
jgi:hypothetical protein